MPCASIPIDPSVTIQVSRALAFLSGDGPSGSDALEFLERFVLNFFSILLALEHKVAQ
jgi:hypothetical protein